MSFFPHQKIQLPFLLHMARSELGLGPLAPEQVYPARPPDGAARVLVHDETCKGDPFFDSVVLDHRLRRRDNGEGALGEEPAVRGDGTARGERHADLAPLIVGAAQRLNLVR